MRNRRALACQDLMTSLKIPKSSHRVVYLGTPEIAVHPLKEMHKAGIEIALVVTGSDKRRGRGNEKGPTAVKLEARKLGIPVSHQLEDICEVNADIGVIVAYGKLIPEEILKNLPMVNIHFSLLPRWRGAAPLERAILSGDEHTGVCIMQVEKKLDTGGIFRSRQVPILKGDSLKSLASKLSVLGSELLLDCFDEGFGIPQPQVGNPTYAQKLTNREQKIEWKNSTEEILRMVRLGNAWTTVKKKRLGVLEASERSGESLKIGEIRGTIVGTGNGAIELIAVKPEGKKDMEGASWANGLRLDQEDRLGE